MCPNPLQRSRANRPTDAARQIEIAIGLICTCLPTMDEYFQSRKNLQSNSQRLQPRMESRTRRFLKISMLRPHRPSTPERAAPAASHAAPGIQVERNITVTGAYSPEKLLRPQSYCLQPSTIESCATPSTSLESGPPNSTTGHQTKEAAPPIPEKSSARLSIHRKSWGPATTLSSYVDSENDTVTKHYPEPRYNSSLQEKEWLPCFPPPLFSEVRGIPPILEVITPASLTSSAQHSPRTLRLSPRWNRWPRSSTAGPSPPISPVQDLLHDFEPPPMWQIRYADQDYRHYSV